MSLYSCAVATCEKIKIQEIDPLEKKRFAKPLLNCLGFDLKKTVLDRIWNCEDRVTTYEDSVKDYNKSDN